MGLKLLHSADWHLGSAFSAFSGAQRTALRRAQESLPSRIGQIVREEAVDLVLLAGDLFDGDPAPCWVELLRGSLEQYGVPVFIAPGNHDPAGPGSPWNQVSWPENVHVFTGDLSCIVLEDLDCRVYGAGYQSMDCPPLLTDFRAGGAERYCIGVLHGDPVNRSSPCCPITTAQVRESGLDYLALGHIHQSGFFRAGDTLCAWPGCPMGRGWDETGEKGVCIVTLDQRAELRPLVLDTPRFHDLTLTVEGDALAALEDALPGAGSGDFYRVTLNGWGSISREELLRRFDRFPNLELRDRLERSQTLWEPEGEDSLPGIYFRLLRESEDPRAELTARISRQLLAGREVELP